MELQTNLIHRNYHKCEAKNQITIGDDYSVPEGKPDIAAILQKRAELELEEVHTEKGKVRIRGNLKLWVLYLAERSSQSIACLNAEFPFDEILYMEGASNGDHLKLDWQIDDLRVTIIHPGKLGVRALVTLSGNITAAKSEAVAYGIDDQPEVYTKTGTFRAAEPVFDRKESFRVRDEVNLPANKPNVQNILWKDLQLRGLDLRMQEGRIALKGELLMLVIYEAEDETGSIQWLEQSVPFQGNVDVSGLSAEMFGLIRHEIAHQEIEVKPDYDGELRMLQIEFLLDLHLQLYEEQTYPVLYDAYSTKEQLTLQTEQTTQERLRMCNQAKYRISAQEQIDEEQRILQLLGHHARMQDQRCQRTEQGILCEGNVEVQVLYVTGNDERPFGSTSFLVPYSQLIEIPEMQSEDTFEVCEYLEQLFLSMQDGGRIEVRGNISFHVCVMQQCRMDNVTALETAPYDLRSYQEQPGMTIHFVQPQETLWSIAKQNRTTMEEVKRQNDLTAEEVVPGQKLLLVKCAAAEMF